MWKGNYGCGELRNRDLRSRVWMQSFHDAETHRENTRLLRAWGKGEAACVPIQNPPVGQDGPHERSVSDAYVAAKRLKRIVIDCRGTDPNPRRYKALAGIRGR